MTFIPDDTLRHLRTVADLPDLTGTRYEIVDHVARGGMGVVYLARDTELGRDVALKVLSVDDTRGEVAARLLKEARILARLEHPGIVPVHDVGTLADGRVFYTMKFVRGQRLDVWAGEGDGADPSDVLRVFARVCEAVAFAHSHGVIHRDLKPANIMVGAFGEVLVLDWGVAKTLEGPMPAPAADPGAPSQSLVADPDGDAVIDTHADTVVAPGGPTHPGTVIGTPGYMAPEQERGDVDHIDRRTDVFALGAILRELVAGSGTPRRLRAIAAKAMSPRPADRYQTAETLARDVTRFLDGMPVSAYEEGIFERLRRVAVRHKVPIALILAYLLMRVLLFIFTRT